MYIPMDPYLLLTSLLLVLQIVCTEGPERVKELIAMGASFDHGEDGRLHLAREGGHSHNRIVHSADMTGREIERALLQAVENDENISLFGHHYAIDLLTCQVGNCGSHANICLIDLLGLVSLLHLVCNYTLDYLMDSTFFVLIISFTFTCCIYVHFHVPAVTLKTCPLIRRYPSDK
jgi:hypothetical protein